MSNNRPSFPPRWMKAFRDMWIYKGRSLLVILTIAVGVAGIGAMGQALVVLSRAMTDTQLSVQPAQIMLTTAPFGDEGILGELQELPGVQRAEALSFYKLRINVSADDNGEPAEDGWRNFELFAFPGFTDKQVDQIIPDHIGSEWPPSDGMLLLERLAAQYLGVHINDPVWIETPDSEIHRLRVDGTVRNAGRESATLSRIGSGFVTMETLADSFGLPSDYNTIVLRILGDDKDAKLLEMVAADAREFLRDRSIEVHSTWIPEPGKHWDSDIVTSMGSILQSLGALALVAAAFLVVNTMLAILSSQLRQIGVMQVIGADPNSLVRMYLTQAGILGLLALAIGLPIGALGASALTGQSNTLLNFKSDGYEMSYFVLALQIAIGIGLPLIAAYLPIHKGTRISLREAIGGVNLNHGSHSVIDRLLEGIRGLPRPFMLSLRNTFRQKGRLMLTLITLGLGGAIVVSVFSVHASLMNTLDQSLAYADYDVRVTTDKPHHANQLAEIARNVPGVLRTEQWGLIPTHRVYPDGSESTELTVEALPADSDFIHPYMVQGDWLSPGEDDAIVLDSYLLRKHPDLKVGDPVVLKMNEKNIVWRIKGFARKTVGEAVCYITKEGMFRAFDDDSQASLIHIMINEHDPASQSAAESDLKTRLKDEGIAVTSTDLTTEMRSVQEARMNIVVVFLSMVAVLLSIVSSLGLAGTMSLNVLERTREFGILRCIGAKDSSIAWIVMAEGMFLGALGWGAGCILAVPVTVWMCQSVGLSLYQAPLDMIFSWNGVAYWFVSAIVLSSLASLAPAWNAIRLSVQQVLAYE